MAAPSAEPPGSFRYRPRMIRWVVWVAAATVLVAAVVLGAALRGPINEARPAVFGLADQLALVGLGLVGAGVLLLFSRPLVEADADGVRVRNVFGSRHLPWQVVRAIRYERGASWATLELQDDDVLGVLAVQAVDKERAVAATRELRAWHAAAIR